MENENIDQTEKEKIVNDLTVWIFQLEKFNDIDMLYELTDMKTVWEEGIDWSKVDTD